jgi:hypothetical protein
MTQEIPDKYKEQITKIEEEFSDVLMNNYIFAEVKKVIECNERLANTGNHFFVYMGRSFEDSLVLAVRRQLGTRKDAISLHRLLNDLTKPPLVITRDYFLGFWKVRLHPIASQITLELGRKTFDELVGPDKSHLERKQIQSDISFLKSKSQLIVDYVNQHRAHYSDKPPLPVYPTSTDLSEAIAAIHRLVRKYYTLLTGTILNDFAPTFLYDWKAIFTFPWIDTSARRA